jgi:protein-S-isoprenylcysteine O-methyltransferase Ste14
MTPDLIRIVSYAVMSIAFVYLAIDDHERRSLARWLWMSFAVQNVAVLLLLAISVQGAASWLDIRWMLTPFTVVSTGVLTIFAVIRFMERKRYQSMIRALNREYEREEQRDLT